MSRPLENLSYFYSIFSVRVLALQPKTDLKKCVAHLARSMRQVLLRVSGEANLGQKKPRIRTCIEGWALKGTHMFRETNTCEAGCQVGLGRGNGKLHVCRNCGQLTHNELAKMNLSLAGPDWLIVMGFVLPNHTLNAVLWLLMKCSGGLTATNRIYWSCSLWLFTSRCSAHMVWLIQQSLGVLCWLWTREAGKYPSFLCHVQYE